jgi:F420-non-reducing hydrogenase iron-sulfur subunit
MPDGVAESPSSALGFASRLLRRTGSTPRNAALARLEAGALGNAISNNFHGRRSDRSEPNHASRISQSLAKGKKERNMSEKFEPVILGFLCNWCAYAGGDLAGVSRLQYPPNMRAVRVMCTGMVHPDLVLEAFNRGADGVLVMG